MKEKTFAQKTILAAIDTKLENDKIQGSSSLVDTLLRSSYWESHGDYSEYC